MGTIFYLMGKSATGKDHIYEALRNNAALRLSRIVLYTTRPKRSGETDGVEYFFVDEERLAALRAEGRIIEERCYETVQGPWYYFTADEGQLRPETQDYVGIGTLESYEKLKAYFGEARLFPVYIETEDAIRLRRALQREEKQEKPDYAELCRRFLADCEDFSEEKLERAGIRQRFPNNAALETVIAQIEEQIRRIQKNSVVSVDDVIY